MLNIKKSYSKWGRTDFFVEKDYRVDRPTFYLTNSGIIF